MDNNAFNGVDISKLISSMPPVTPQFKVDIPEIPKIDPKSTVQYKIQEQTRLLTEQNEQQIKMLQEQNEQLRQLLMQQEKELNENKATLVKSDKYNKSMKRIAIIACIVAFASFVLTALIGFGVIG